MTNRLHVGVTVIPTRSDFFFSLRKWTGRRPAEQFRALTLPPDLLDLVRRLEYSSNWFARFWNYRPVVAHLEREIASIVESTGSKGEGAIFYLPDDGYWAELFYYLRKKHGWRFRLVNVQHGMPTRSRRKTIAVRRAINRGSEILFGAPNFGYGFGAGSLDGYIVMSDVEKSYITTEFRTPTFVAPEFIRGDLFESAASKHIQRPANSRPRVMFATGPIFARSPANSRSRNEQTYFHDIGDTLRILSEQIGCDIVVRFHPNEDLEAAHANFLKFGIDTVATIDTNRAVLDTLLSSDFVLSYSSTVLFEANWLGVVPINWSPVAYPAPPLSSPTETLRFKRDATGRASLEVDLPSLQAMFDQTMRAKYARDVHVFDEEADLPWLDLPLRN